MRERVAASARRGLAAVRRFKRAGMAAIALGAGVLAFAAPADVARGVAWLQAQVQTDGSLPGPLTEGAHQQARCETAATLIKLAGNSAQVASLLAALESPDRATETAACWQRLRQKLGQTTLGADLGNRRVSSQGYAAYGSASAPNALDTGWALQAQLQNLSSTDREHLVAWLQTTQDRDGGFAVAGRADLIATAAILRGLEGEAATSAAAAALATKSAAWLLAQRNPEGNWLNDVSSTALVFEAVHPYSGAKPDVAAAVASYLASRQDSDGSWQGDAYVTAIALRALALTSAPALDPTLGGLRVMFVDSRTGTPVPGVLLRSVSGGISETSSASGAISLTNIPAISYQFLSSASGFATVSFGATLVPSEIVDLGTIQLVAATNSTRSIVSGTVRDQDSEMPLAGALVSVEGQGRTALTASDGSYLVYDVSPGSITISANKTGYLSAAVTVNAQAGQVFNFSPWLKRSSNNGSAGDCKITGLVLQASNMQPLASAMISVSGANTNAVYTDSVGKFSTPNLVSGAVTVVATKAGYESVTASTQLSCSPSRVTAVDFSPRLYAMGQSPANANTASLAGVVMSAATNQPIQGAQLVLTPIGGVASTALSGADGSFAFSGLSAALAQLQIAAAGYAGITLQYAPTPLESTDVGQIRLRAPSGPAAAARSESVRREARHIRN